MPKHSLTQLMKERLMTHIHSALLVTLLLCAGCATNDYQGFVAVNGTRSIVKLNRGRTDNIYPWLRTEANKNENEILVSNSCGFVHVVYERSDNTKEEIEMSKASRTWEGLETMGEWCRISDLVVDGETLILFRTWRGENYILQKTPIFTDGNGERFIGLHDFIKNSDLSNLLENIREPETGTGCYDSDDYWYGHASELGTIFETHGRRCFSEGVYVKSIREFGERIPRQALK
jgi:hypothetical protein